MSEETKYICNKCDPDKCEVTITGDNKRGFTGPDSHPHICMYHLCGYMGDGAKHAEWKKLETK